MSLINGLLNSFRFRKRNWKKIGKVCVKKGFVVISPEAIAIGDNFYAEENLKLQAWKHYGEQVFTPSITIGKNVSIMENCQISSCLSVAIGDGCLFGANVFVTDNFHGDNSRHQLSISPIERPLYVKGKVEIGNNVWIGRNVCIMPGVTIGDGVVIGANAVVTNNIPDYCVAVGVPAKVIGKAESFR